jgi:hypothetical protein
VIVSPASKSSTVPLVLQVDQAIALCSEMHNIKEAMYENKKKLEAIGDDYQIQVGLCFRLSKTLSVLYDDSDTVI